MVAVDALVGMPPQMEMMSRLSTPVVSRQRCAAMSLVANWCAQDGEISSPFSA